MVIIYVKLGSATEFYDERLKVNMSAGMPVAALDYENINDDVNNALNALRILQISEAEYYSLLSGVVVDSTIPLNTVVLASAINYWNNPIPDPAVFFMYYQGAWWKVPWSLMKGTSLNPILHITNADFANATDYNNPNIVGKPKQVFFNQSQRFLDFGTEWEETLTGIKITLAGFNATLGDLYDIFIVVETTTGTSSGTAGEQETLTLLVDQSYVLLKNTLITEEVLLSTTAQTILIGDTPGGAEIATVVLAPNIPKALNIPIYAGLTDRTLYISGLTGLMKLILLKKQTL